MIEIVGNEHLLSTLLSAVREKKVAGCYLIEGDEGTGKLDVARYVAASLVCQNPRADATPCLSCNHCKAVSSGSFVDCIELRPEEEGKNIPVDLVRQALREAYIVPSQGDWRIFIIEHAEGMKKEAQNTLLKSIEEPRGQTVFFLLTKDMSKLLPTVRSRAVKMRTEKASDDALRSLLQKENPTLSPERLEEAIRLSDASPGKARKILNDPGIHEMREKVLSYFKALLDGAGFTRLCLIFPPSSTTRGDLAKILPMVKMALRDLMRTRFGTTPTPMFFTDSSLLRDLASIISPLQAAKLFATTEHLEGALKQNVGIYSALAAFHLTAQKITREN